MKLPSLIAATLGLTLAAAPALAQTADETSDEISDEKSDETSDGAAGGETGYDLETPLAEVDGTPVTLGELLAIRRELPEQYQQLPDKVLYDGILEQLIDQLLLAEAAREAGLDERPTVALALRNQARAILADSYLEAQLAERVTPEKIEELYRERHVEGEPVEEVRAAHILVETEEEAREIKAKLDEGAGFGELAKEHGTDGTAQRGGDLGWFTRSEMVPQFAEAVFSMEPGTIRGPVETDFGWHLIKLDERRDRPAPPLEEVEDDLREELVRQAQLEIVEELRAEVAIEKPDAPVPPEAIRADGMLEAAQ